MPPHGYRKSITRLKIERILTPEHLREYEVLMRDRRSTVRTLRQWILDRGYQVGHASVGRHRRRFDAEVQTVRRAAMFAERFADASKEGGLAALADATVARFQQVFIARLMKLDSDESPDGANTAAFSPRDWHELAKAVESSVASRRSLEVLRNEFDERARRAAEAKGKATPRRLDGAAVSDKVRRILGIPLPGEPLPTPPTPALPPPAEDGGLSSERVDSPNRPATPSDPFPPPGMN